MNQKKIEFDIEDIDNAAQQFLQFAGDRKIYLFSGELGTGKTTFIAALCRHLGVKQVVSSPTFAIIQQYNTDRGADIYHMDLYRIRGDEEAIRTGIEDCLLSGNICMVEWPENAPGIFPDKPVKTSITIEGKNRRKLLIQFVE